MAILLPHPPNLVTWFEHSDPSRPTVERRQIGQWRLAVARDPFTGKVHCELKARGMAYGPAAMTFFIGARADTFAAVYKIDNGPATPWRVNAMTLASRGVALQTDSLTNPSGGKVFVPTPALTGAQSVTIRVSPSARPRAYRLDDLPAAVAAAQSAGCGSDFKAVISE